MLPKTILYVLRAMSMMAKLPEGKFIGAKAMGEHLSIPVNYLGKMLQVLARKGMLISQKGMGGGFAIAGNPDSIMLWDVINAYTEGNFLDGCFWGTGKCPENGNCTMHSKWNDLIEHAQEVYKNTSITDIMENV